MGRTLTLFVLTLLFGSSSIAVDAFSSPSAYTARTQTVEMHASPNPSNDKEASPAVMGRSTFLSHSVAAAFLAFQTTQPAHAKVVPITVKKGTKDDPLFKNCVSECIYDCTKSAGDDAKAKEQCAEDCEKKCATDKTKDQIGLPTIKGSGGM